MTIQRKAKATWRHNSESIGTQEKWNCEKVGNSGWRSFQNEKTSNWIDENKVETIYEKSWSRWTWRTNKHERRWKNMENDKSRTLRADDCRTKHGNDWRKFEHVMTIGANSKGRRRFAGRSFKRRNWRWIIVIFFIWFFFQK